jgi:hypothetical protein
LTAADLGMSRCCATNVSRMSCTDASQDDVALANGVASPVALKSRSAASQAGHAPAHDALTY